MPRTAAKPRKKAKPAAVARVSSNKRSEVTPPVVETSGHAVGDMITHPMFGEGEVTAVDADKLSIKFKDGRVRQIVDYYVRRRERSRGKRRLRHCVRKAIAHQV